MPVISRRAAEIAGYSDRRTDRFARAWTEFAGDIGMTAPFVLKQVKTLSRKVIAACPTVADRIAEQGFGGEMLDRISATVADRAHALCVLVS